MTDLLRRVAELSPERRALLASLLQQEEGIELERSVIVPQERNATHYPLSFGQQRLWFLDQLEPGSSAYNVPQAVRLTGSLDLRALERTFSEIVRRHEVLRCSFATVDGEPIQIIARAKPLSLSVVDLSGRPEAEQKAHELAREEARRPFDLARGPLLRIGVLKLDENDHVVLLTMHHIVSDDWSMGVLVHEVAALYRAHLTDRPSPLSELSIQYVDFACWQRRWLEGEKLEQQLAFWRRQLEAAPEVLDLPTDRPRRVAQCLGGAGRRMVLPETLSNALRALSRQQGVTLFVTLLAAFKVLLCRYTGQRDLCVGSPVAGRNQPGTEELIGFFVNTLVLRTDLSGDPAFRELLQREREVVFSAQAHQDLPFERLVDELQPDRELTHTPLFQVMFVLQNAPVDTLAFPGLEVGYLPAEGGTAAFDLTLAMAEEEEVLDCALEFNPDLFDDTSITRILRQYRSLLEGICAQPQERLCRLPLLSPSEGHQILLEWNDARRGHCRERCLHELFEAQVERTPDAPAVVLEGERWTYRELNQRANRLAHRLRASGVGPERVVAICLERSLDMMVSVFGALKAGGAYLPLDPAQPADRLAFMLEEAQAAGGGGRQEGRESLPEAAAEMLCLDQDAEQIAGESDADPENSTDSDCLASILYTSGSTGRPRGVAITHRGVVSLVTGAFGIFSPEDLAGLLSTTSIVYSCSLFEFFVPLCRGGCLILAQNALQLPTLSGSEEVSLINIVPSAMAELMRLDEIPASVRTVNLQGEFPPIDLIRELYQRSHVRQVFNGYGPTEVTTYSNFSPVGRKLEGAPAVGHPIAGTRVCLLDGSGSNVPTGAVGEIHIAGEGLARGYSHRPGLSAEKFLPDPFSREPGGRLYKSGDLARYLVNGEIQLLGRADQQVKIRGFRVELKEVEAVLGQHPSVHQAVVVVRGETSSARLVAYTVPEGPPASASELRRFLQARLPEYMVPSVFVRLEVLPRMPSGKVDRQALPEPAETRSAAAGSAAERTPVEEILASIWADVLSLDGVDPEENFFDLGGHSLLATRLISRVREVFQVEVSLRQLFEAPTVKALAEKVEDTMSQGATLQAPPFERIDRDGEMPLSFGQQRLWFIDRLEPGNPFYNIAITFRLTGRFSVRALERALRDIERRHEVLRATFATVDGDPVQRIAPTLSVNIPLTDLSALADQERQAEFRRLVAEETQRSFDLERGPLMRVRLVRLREQIHQLLVTFHHIVADGWSVGLFVHEMTVLYEAFLAGRPSPLPELHFQYADYASWQRRWLQGETLERELSYWKERLADAPPVLEVPTDRSRPPVQRFRGEDRRFRLPADHAAALIQFSRQHGSTLFITLLAAFKILLARYAGQRDIVVGSPVANRSRVEIERLIGFFVNTLVLRTDLSGARSFQCLAGRVREVVLEAHAHQDLPLEMLVDELQPQRSLSHSPLFQVMFTMNTATEGEIETIFASKPLGVESGTAKFDLSLYMEEASGRLDGSLAFDTDLYDETTIRRMVKHFLSLLAACGAGPEQDVFTLPLLAGSERHQLLVETKSNRRALALQPGLHHPFEASAARHPERIAVVLEDERLTYGELNHRANQLAHHLIDLGVGPEVVVGISMERCPAMIVAMLGILKAGGAYLPLDPANPHERLRLILRQAGAPILLTHRGLFTGRDMEFSIEVLRLDADRRAIARHSTRDPMREVPAASLAYVIFTSGTSGAPKGVGIEHRQIMSYVSAMADRLPGPRGSNFATLATFATDLGNTMLYRSLATAGCLHIITEERITDPVALAEYFASKPIDFLKFVPSHLAALIDSPQAAALLPHRQLILGGEAASWTLVDEVLRLAPATRVLNHYGPTETTCGVMTYEVVKKLTTGRPGSTVPIGRPLAGTRGYILDACLQPVGIGMPGQLYIAGSNPGRGYLSRPQETAKAFVPHPFSGVPGERLYATGDLVRILPAGATEFLGRIDEQVKLRGFRIELGEIKRVLEQHPTVEKALVLLHESASGEARIVAYLVLARGTLSVDELHAFLKARGPLRQFLSSKLPEYMIPSSFTELKTLPLTPNGKLDRRALPMPDGEGTELEKDVVAPRDTLELQLTQIWEKVLNRRPIGLTSDFFELGGHSLVAVRMMTEIRRNFGHELPLRTLFQVATIEEFAKILRQDIEILPQSTLVEIQPGGSAPPLFCVHPLGGGALCYMDLGRCLGENQPVYGLQSRGYEDGREPLTSIEEMATFYIEAIRKIQDHGPYMLGAWSFGGHIAFEMAQQLHARGESVALLALFDVTIEESEDCEFDAPLDLAGLLNLPISMEDLRPLDHPDKQLAFVVEKGKRTGRLPADLEMDEAKRLRDLAEINYQAGDAYAHQSYPGKILLFRAEDGDGAPRGRALGWDAVVGDRIEVLDIPGEHLDILRKPYVQVLAEKLRTSIETVAATRP